jgi:hypothetical protein
MGGGANPNGCLGVGLAQRVRLGRCNIGGMAVLMKRAILLLALVLLLPLPARADSSTLVCKYLTYDKEGGHRWGFTLTFIIDRGKATAYRLGKRGSAEVQVGSDGRNLTFIEVTDVGYVMSTTVNLDNGTSVHMVMLGKSVVRQYHGACIFKA